MTYDKVVEFLPLTPPYNGSFLTLSFGLSHQPRLVGHFSVVASLCVCDCDTEVEDESNQR